MNPDFMDKLQALREAIGQPVTINSGFRCIIYDKSIGGAGVHPKGRAADIKIMGADADKLVGISYGLGFTGRGISQRGEWAGRFIHLDDLQGVKRPRVWSY